MKPRKISSKENTGYSIIIRSRERHLYHNFVEDFELIFVAKKQNEIMR